MNSSMSSDDTGYPGNLRTLSAGSLVRENSSHSSLISDANSITMASFSPFSGLRREPSRPVVPSLPSYASNMATGSRQQFPTYIGQASQSFTQGQSQVQSQFQSLRTTPSNNAGWPSMQHGPIHSQAPIAASQQFYSVTGRSSSNSAVGKPSTVGVADPLGISGQLLDDDEVLDVDGSIAAQLHKRDLEVQTLKLEVKRLNRLLKPQGIERPELLVDPAVEHAYRNLSKCLEKRDGEIARLQFHLEATMAAISAGNAQSKSGINKTKTPAQDPGELAHRLISRITSLRDENILLAVRFIKRVIDVNFSNRK